MTITFYLHFSIKQDDQKFAQEPPTIHNTYCATPAYQFLPFNQNSDIPKFAIEFSAQPNRHTYIGRLSNKDVDQLCQIFYNGTEFVEIKPIPYDDDRNIDPNGDSIEVSVDNCKEFSFNVSRSVTTVSFSTQIGM